MPTKPSATVTIWASNALHLFGDYPGDPTKVSAGAGVVAAGLIPGDPAPPTAEECNNEFNIWTQFLEWVKLGTSANDADAHLVETDDDGDISVRRGEFFTDGAFLNAVEATATGGGAGVYGESNGNGVVGQSVFGGSGYGVRGFASSNSSGVRGQGSGIGYGGYFTAGSGGVGVRAEGGGVGLEAVGDDGEPDILLQPFGNYGIDILCTASALGGIRVVANGQVGISITQDNANFEAMTLFGDSAAAAGVATLDVRAFGAGNAARLVASSGTGYCARLSPKLVAPSRGALLFDGHPRPTTYDSGQHTYLSEGTGHFARSSFEDAAIDPGPGAGWRPYWDSPGGMALAHNIGAAYILLGGSYEVVATARAEGGNAPKIAGRKGMFRLSFMPRIYDTAAIQRINIKVRDMTANSDVKKWEGAGGGAGNGVYFPIMGFAGFRAPVSIDFELTLPAGDRYWTLQLSCTDSCDIRDPALVLLGIK
jgi:hypothetical protein